MKHRPGPPTIPRPHTATQAAAPGHARSARLAVAALGLLLAAGCATRPSATPVLAPDVDQALSAFEAQRDAELTDFHGDLSLLAAKRLALAHSPDMRTALARLQRAAASLDRARSALGPRVDASAGVQHIEPNGGSLDLGALGLPGQRADGYETYSASVSASYLLWDWYARTYQVHAAGYSAQASEAAQADAQRLLVAAVSQTWYAVLLAQQNIRIADADIAYTEQLLADTRQRLAVGKATTLDEMNFQIRLNNARASRLQADQTFQTTGVALMELLGLSALRVDTDIRLPETLNAEAQDRSLAQLVALAFANRPDLHQLQLEVAAAEAQAEAIRADRKPKLAATAEAGASRQDALPQDRDDLSGAIGLSATFSVFDAGEKAAAWREALADVESARATLDKRRNATISAIRQRMIDIDMARERVALQRETVDLSRRTRDLEKQKYDLGKSTLTRFNEVQSSLVNAEAALALSQISLLNALEALKAETAANLP